MALGAFLAYKGGLVQLTGKLILIWCMRVVGAHPDTWRINSFPDKGMNLVTSSSYIHS